MAGAKMKLVRELTMEYGEMSAITFTMTINIFANATVVFQEQVIIALWWRQKITTIVGQNLMLTAISKDKNTETISISKGRSTDLKYK